MKKEYKQKRSQGFTIIEVLIVLAIAALILLIVFLAVPALQRNSRNTSRRADISNMLASINEYVANNNGSTPASLDATGLTTLKWGAAASTQAETKVNYYTKGAGTGAGQVDYHTSTAGTIGPLAGTGPADYATVYVGGDCDPAVTGGIKQGGTRSIAAQYEVENGSNSYKPACLSS